MFVTATDTTVQRTTSVHFERERRLSYKIKWDHDLSVGEDGIDSGGAEQPTVCSQGGREWPDHSSEPALSAANTPRDSTRYGSGGPGAPGALRSRDRA